MVWLAAVILLVATVAVLRVLWMKRGNSKMDEGRITVAVKDCQRNDPTPELDLYFPNAVAERFHWEHKQPVELLLDEGAPWRGTVGIKPPNPPYLHRPLTRGGEKMSMRYWLLDQGIADGACVELIQESPTRFRWSRVLDPGKWSPGRDPKDRPTARLRKPSGIKPSWKDSATSSQTPVKTFDISTLKTPEDRTEFYARLWTTIRDHLNKGIPNWQEKIVDFGQVAAAESREKGKGWSDNEVFEGVVKGILSSNTDWAKIERVLPGLQSLFQNFELNYYASLSESDVLNKIHPWFKERRADSQNLKQGLVRLIETSKKLLIYSKHYGDLDNFITALLKENNSDPKLLAFQFGSNSSKHKLKGMGIALAAEALRNIGFDIAKPDMHINRAMGCFGLVQFDKWSESYINSKGEKATRFIEINELPGDYSHPEANEANSLEVMKRMEDFANSIKVRPVFLDNAIWLLCANSGLHATNEELKKWRFYKADEH